MPATAAFDEATLTRLAREVGDRGAAVLVASRYRQLLGRRVRRVTGALRQPDVESALDALLSLRTSSLTVGTRELADLAGTVEQAVRRHDVVTARSQAALLWPAAVRADEALGCYLGTCAADCPGRPGCRVPAQSASSMR